MQSYVVRPKVDKTGKKEKTLYYGVPILSGQVDEELLAAEACERCTLTEADMLAAICSLKDLIRQHLEYGQSVKIKGIGIFSVSASSEGCESPETCTPAKIKAQRVCFKADNEMRSVLFKMKYVKSNRRRTKK
jgi:predicted histone-like DNA-binding protein